MRVYVAGPVTGPDQDVNVFRACAAATQLMEAGHDPFVPHTSVLWNMSSPRPYSHWIKWCKVWVGQCEALVRLPGDSSGADDEVAVAHSLGIPVYLELGAFFGGRPLIKTRTDATFEFDLREPLRGIPSALEQLKERLRADADYSAETRAMALELKARVQELEELESAN